MRDAKEKAKELFDLHFSIQEQIEWSENPELYNEADEFQKEHIEEVSFYWRELAKNSSIITANSIRDYYKFKGLLKTSDEIYWDVVISEIISI